MSAPLCEPGWECDVSHPSAAVPVHRGSGGVPSFVCAGTGARLGREEHWARVAHRLLCGHGDYAADRRFVEQLLAVSQDAPQLARSVERFRERAVRYLAPQAYQIVELDVGLPVSGRSLHSVARRANPDARVTYVGSDASVLAHARVLLADHDSVHVVDADIRDPGACVAKVMRRHLDPSVPTILVWTSTLQYHDDPTARTLLHGYCAALPPGSFVVLATLRNPQHPPVDGIVAGFERVYQRSAVGPVVFRTDEQFVSLLPPQATLLPASVTGAEVIVACDEWWPDGPQFRDVTPLRPLTGAAIWRTA